MKNLIHKTKENNCIPLENYTSFPKHRYESPNTMDTILNAHI